MEFNNLQQLIDAVKNYSSGRRTRRRLRSNSHEIPTAERTPLNYDFEALVKCLGPLEKLNRLIGMDSLKRDIIDQLLFFSQELNSNEMMHTCLTGPPGVGKTTLGKILAELYCSMGFLSTDNFTFVSRADLIAGYLGQTALKTKKVLEKARGGVLFIDEAYSLGTSSDGDGYGKECIDTINLFLSENTKDFIMIIAGYREDLDKSFFAMNRGLDRRFPWRYDIEKYSVANLVDIFRYQVAENYWYIHKDLTVEMLVDLFKNRAIFENNGGDTLQLFDKSKITHSRRVFGRPEIFKRVLTFDDIRLTIESIAELRLKKNSERAVPYGMYV
jgi:SpoVK/Ycf46/Vps4 family AAA+-type ATPase